MRYILPLMLLATLTATSQKNKTVIKSFEIPDTLKAAQWYAEISVADAKKGFYGTSFQSGSIGLQRKGKHKLIVFNTSPGAEIISAGLNTTGEKQTISWKYNWKEQTPYRLLVTALTDSATHSSYYTGYVFLPEEKKWKFLASVKTTAQARYLKMPAVVTAGKKTGKQLSVQDAWLQRSNGSWRNLLNETAKKPPVISVTNHVDSAAQAMIDKNDILAAQKQLTGSADDVYYLILQEGKGNLVNLTDTVSVFYKGSLLKDGSVFDQTKEKPAKFPLARLIKGWQLGLVKCRVGGKIRMIIPSGLAYSTRSRSKDIPPNSVLVFEIEVLESTPASL